MADMFIASADLEALREASRSLREELSETTRTTTRAQASIGRFSASIGRSFVSAVEAATLGGKSASEALRGLGLSLASTALRGALSPIGDAVGAAAGGLASRVVGGLSGPVKAFARGGAVVGGAAGPSLFPLSGGVGVAGEAGAEAILPLTRGPDGRLGVAAASAGGAGRPVSVSVSIQTPDAESFRRSRSQVAAQMARAIDRARRDL